MPRTLQRRRTERDTSYAAPAEEETPTAPARRGRRTAAAEPEKPTRGRRTAKTETTSEKPKASKGWGSYTKTAEATKSGFADEFKPREGETELIKIMDDSPFAVYKQHWIERGKGKKKSFNCLKDEDDNGDCPLCDDLGDSPRACAELNVIDMLEDPEKQQVLVWRVRSFVGDILRKAADEKRTSPINRLNLYWSVEKVTKGNSTKYQVVPVKADDDFETDWDVVALTQEDMDLFAEECYDDSEVTFSTHEELKEIVDEVSKQ